MVDTHQQGIWSVDAEVDEFVEIPAHDGQYAGRKIGKWAGATLWNRTVPICPFGCSCSAGSRAQCFGLFCWLSDALCVLLPFSHRLIHWSPGSVCHRDMPPSRKLKTQLKTVQRLHRTPENAGSLRARTSPSSQASPCSAWQLSPSLAREP